MQLKFDWLIVLENLRRGIMVTDTTLEGPSGPRIIYVNSAWLKMTGYGREELANQTPRLLQGKHKPTYTPFIDTGDFVVVVNAAKVKLTGRKEDQKIYRQHSGYEGGLREERARIVRQRKPHKLVEDAVHGMLPKTKMGEAMYRKLKVYAGPDHPHAAQKPSKREVA